MNTTYDSVIVEAMVGVEIPWPKGLASMFYMVSPTESSYKTLEEVPQFYRKAWPYFLLFIAIENILLWVEKKPLMRVNDGLTSLAHGLFQECGRLVFRGGEHALYIFIYENFHFVDLRWESPVTWYIAAIGVDFCYYWVHRASHEVHILWAQHQVHHSSEDYNLAVGLRQSILQGWCGFIFYLPMALFVPPAQFLTHQQFNLLYQFWIHTETVKSLGPLEWLLNTPKHHRVHHGSTLYCLDKNYGGFLIIWDRIFGTFQEEREKKEVIYGLVKHEPSFNPLYLQVFYNKNVLDKMHRMEGWRDKVGAVVKGPSWLPGKPWTGADEDKIDVKWRVKYDVKLPTWLNVYIVIHFALVTVGFQELALRYVSMSPVTVLLFVGHILGALTILGLLLDADSRAPLYEVLRCILLTALVHHCASALRDPILSPQLMILLYLTSATFWALRYLLGLKHVPHHRIGWPTQ